MTHPTTETPISFDTPGTAPGIAVDTTPGSGSDSTDSTKAEQAKAAAGTAAEETKHVAGVAQEEAGKVAGEAVAQVKSLAGEARTEVSGQVADQTRQQRDKLVTTLGTLGEDLEQMAERTDGGGLAADIAREAAQHARSLTSYLDGKEPGEMLGDVRDFARRRPGTFLLGALVAGVVAGRLARGVKDAESPAPSGPTSSGPAAVTGVPGYATGPTAPLAPAPVTPVVPAYPAAPAPGSLP